MRALWISDLEVSEDFILKGDELHHLVNVVRIKEGDELLLLNGKGLKVITTVQKLSKKELHLSLKQHQTVDRNYIFDLALGMPKREALELCLKEATELGFRRIYLVRSEYSQMRYPEVERMQKLLVSALEQSNGAFLPELHESDWETLPWEEYTSSLLLDSQTIDGPAARFEASTLSTHLLVIGPEGGFSGKELALLHTREKIKIVNLPTPILRTPTALATGAGIMIESLLK